MRFKHTYFAILFLFSCITTFAQNGLQTPNIYNSIASQQYQPANLALRATSYPLTNHYLNAKKWLKKHSDSTNVLILSDSLHAAMEAAKIGDIEIDKKLTLVGFTGNAFIANNRFGFGGLLKDGNYLSTETVDAAVAKMGNKNRFQMGYNGGFAVNLPIKGKSAWGLYLDYNSAFSVGTNNAGTAGLIFRGNAPYAGTTVADDKIFLKSQTRTSLGLAWARQHEKWTFGVKTKFIAGVKSSDILVNNFSLFTSEVGDSIHATADYQYFVSDRSAPLDGFGAGVDLGAMYQVNSALNIGASVTDLGFIAWSGEKMAKNVSQSYTGFALKDLLNLEGNAAGQDALVDSLKGLVFPDTTAAKMTSLLPTTLHINAVYDFNTYNRAFASLHYSFTQYAPMTTMPLFAVGYQRRICSGFSLGVNGYAGGLDTYGVGVMGMSYFRIKKKNPVSIVYSMDNVLGLLGGKGAAAEIGISMGF